MGYGRDYAETHDSPLKQIDQSNVGQLAPAWSVEVGSDGTLETTPLVFNGVLYGTSTWSQVYAIRVIKGKVVIGQGGAEYGVRGFLAGYDAATGKQAWKFYVIPGDPSKPFEDEALARAAKTWNGQWWKYGGGGTPWDGIAYDPELNLVYVGTGNGSPWNANHRRPGGGDNLYLSSIVALNADTGK